MPKSRPRSKMNPKHVELVERKAQALDLVKLGYNTTEVARHLGLKSRQHAHQIITKALQETIHQPAEDARKVCIQRLDLWLQKLASKILKGDVKAITTALKIEERRARLLGLDAPMQLTSPNGSPIGFLVVQVPPQAPTLEDWQAQAREVIDVTPQPVEIDHESDQ